VKSSFSTIPFPESSDVRKGDTSTSKIIPMTNESKKHKVGNTSVPHPQEVTGLGDDGIGNNSVETNRLPNTADFGGCQPSLSGAASSECSPGVALAPCSGIRNGQSKPQQSQSQTESAIAALSPLTETAGLYFPLDHDAVTTDPLHGAATRGNVTTNVAANHITPKTSSRYSSISNGSATNYISSSIIQVTKNDSTFSPVEKTAHQTRFGAANWQSHSMIPRDHGTPAYAATSFAVTPVNHSGNDTAANDYLPVETTPRGGKGHEAASRTDRRVVSDRKTAYLTPLSTRTSHVLSPRRSKVPRADGHYCVDGSPGGRLPEMSTTPGFQRLGLGRASPQDTRKAFRDDSRQEPTGYSGNGLLPQTSEDSRKPKDKGHRSQQQQLIVDVLLESDYKMIQSMHESGLCNLLSPEEEERLVVASRLEMERRGPAPQEENDRMPHYHEIHLVVRCEAKPSPFHNTKRAGAASNEVST
jgi:hypothetical protein